MSNKLFQLNNVNSFGGYTVAQFNTYEDADRMKQLIEVHSRLFHKFVSVQDEVNFPEFISIVKEIEAELNGADFPLLNSGDSLEIKETEIAPPIDATRFDINLQRLKDFSDKVFKM